MLKKTVRFIAIGGFLSLALGGLFLIGGCTSARIPNERIATEPHKISDTNRETNTVEEIRELTIREFMLSPGDQINITVFQHDELDRKIRVPPNGQFFYPIIGEIDTTRKSLRDLRKIITKGLSSYKQTTLLPGDEITINVFRHDEFGRKLMVPPDGHIIFPFVGEIKIEGKNIREVSQIIREGLAEIIVDPQVMVDIVKLNIPGSFIDPQVSVEVVHFGGQKIFVLGEVTRPGVFLADGHMGVVEAISSAGGMTLDAEQTSVVLIRSGNGKSKPELIVLDLEKALTQGDMTQDPTLQRGDIIYVPRTFISNVDRFFEHMAKITRPILDIITGIWIGQNIAEGPGGGGITIIRP